MERIILLGFTPNGDEYHINFTKFIDNKSTNKLYKAKVTAQQLFEVLRYFDYIEEGTFTNKETPLDPA